MNLPFFVYGTLRPGGALHDMFFGGAVASDHPAWMSGGKMMVSPGMASPGIPYVYQVHDMTQTIRGNLLTVHPENYDTVLHYVDQVEGFSDDSITNHYWRRQVVVDSIDGQVKAWCYLAQRSMAHQEGNIPIDGGNYMRYVSEYNTERNIRVLQRMSEGVTS